MTRFSFVEVTAAGCEKARRAPLEKQNDTGEHEDFAEYGGVLRKILQEGANARHPAQTRRPVRQILLQHLVNASNAECADDRAADTSDTANDHDHERIRS